MSFTTISHIYSIPVRRSCRYKAFQGLITEEMEPDLASFFNENISVYSNLTDILIYPLDNSHDVEESLTRVSVDQLATRNNQFDNLQKWISQEYPKSEAFPLIEGLK